jgi:hypothetical protein
VWLGLVRSGSTVTGSVSTDGSNWTEVGSASPNIGSMAIVGVAVTSHVRGVVTAAIF